MKMATNGYLEKVLAAPKEPDFEQMLAVLRHDAPTRPVLCDFGMNASVRGLLAPPPHPGDDRLDPVRCSFEAWRNAGYDYARAGAAEVGFAFSAGDRDMLKSASLNDGALITDRASFEAYPWPDPDTCDYSIFEWSVPAIPNGMKWIVSGPGGVLENLIRLTGFDNLCYMLVDDPDLVQDMSDAIGSRMARYYEHIVPYDTVGAVISNDDWGFKTQTMISPDQLRALIIPWHRTIVAFAHAAGKPAILHSCGQLESVMDDIIDDIRFDGKHSYEDTICPVEQAYDRWGERIAILGGIDMDFLCRATPEQVHDRSRAMLERTRKRGSYALGTGNSLPEYVPLENYFAMLAAAIP